MEWTIIGLFAVAVILLVYSLIIIKNNRREEQEEIDNIHFSLMNEIEQLQKKIRQLELDVEITAQEAFGNKNTPEDRKTMRKVLDLFKRGYSIQGIASEVKLDEETVKKIITPFKAAKNERGSVSNEE